MHENYNNLCAIAAAANRAASDNMGHTPVEIPADPTKVAAAIKKTVTARTTRRESTQVARELADMAENAATRLALDAAPAVTALVVKSYNAAADELAELAPVAPLQLTAHATEDDFNHYTRMLGLVDTLNAALSYRVALLPALGEELRTSLLPWLILDPQQHASNFALRQFLTEHAERLPQSPEEWLKVTALGTTMAPAGHAEARVARYAQAAHAAGQGPDGGMFDRTYGEMVALLPNQVGA